MYEYISIKKSQLKDQSRSQLMVFVMAHHPDDIIENNHAGGYVELAAYFCVTNNKNKDRPVYYTEKIEVPVSRFQAKYPAEYKQWKVQRALRELKGG